MGGNTAKEQAQPIEEGKKEDVEEEGPKKIATEEEVDTLQHTISELQKRNFYYQIELAELRKKINKNNNDNKSDNEEKSSQQKDEEEEKVQKIEETEGEEEEQEEKKIEKKEEEEEEEEDVKIVPSLEDENDLIKQRQEELLTEYGRKKEEFLVSYHNWEKTVTEFREGVGGYYLSVQITEISSNVQKMFEDLKKVSEEDISKRSIDGETDRNELIKNEREMEMKVFSERMEFMTKLTGTRIFQDPDKSDKPIMGDEFDRLTKIDDGPRRKTY